MTRRSREKRLGALEDALAPSEGRDALREMSMMKLQFASMVVSQGGEHNLGVDVSDETLHAVAREKLNAERDQMGLAPIEDEEADR